MNTRKKRLTFKALVYWVLGSYLVIGMQAAGKLSYRYGFAMRQSLVVRYLGGLLLALALVWVIRRSLSPIRSANWRLQTQRSAAMAVVTFGTFAGAKLIGLGLATAFGYSWPAFSLMVGWQRWLGFHEKPDFRSVMSVLMTFIGVGMLAHTRVPATVESSDLAVMGLGTGAVLLASVSSGYQANIAPKIKAFDPDPLTGMVWLMFIGAVLTGLWSVGLWAMPMPSDPLPQFTVIAMAVAFAIAACGFSSQFLYNLATDEAPAKSLTPLTAIFQLPFAIGVGHFAFGEAWPSFEESLWMVVIVVGSLLNYLPMPSARPPATLLGAM